MIVDQQAKQTIRRPRASYQGLVVRDNRDKTIKVVIEEPIKHPRYGKYIHRRTFLHVHDEKNEAQVGDRVQIMATRPISKTKAWRLMRVVRRAGISKPADMEKKG